MILISESVDFGNQGLLGESDLGLKKEDERTGKEVNLRKKI